MVHDGGHPQSGNAVPSERPDAGARTVAELWDALAAVLARELGPDRVARWFSGVDPRSVDARRLVLAVPNSFFADWISGSYGERIDAIARDSLGLAGVRFVVASPAEVARESSPGVGAERATSTDAASASAPTVGSEAESTEGAVPTAASAKPWRSDAPGPLRDVSPALTLDRFVVGSCNRVAYHASLQALRSPGGAYNPIFIHGGCGLGKTHLLQGITRDYFRQGERSIRYLPCEGFVNRFGQAVRRREIGAFRERFRSLRVLVLDDIQVVAGKDRSQLELLETIDRIAGSGGQVLLASDQRPGELHGLAEKLLGRFISGLVCTVAPPDRATRISILRQESIASGMPVDEAAIECVADRYVANVRELLGAWVRVMAHGELLQERLTPQAVEGILAVDAPRTGRVSVDRIIEEVARRYGVPPVDVRGRGRSRTVSLARHIVIYLARVLTDHSLSEIAAFIGGRRHATASHAYRKIQRELRTDEQLRIEVERLLSVLGR